MLATLLESRCLLDTTERLEVEITATDHDTNPDSEVPTVAPIVGYAYAYPLKPGQYV